MQNEKIYLWLDSADTIKKKSQKKNRESERRWKRMIKFRALLWKFETHIQDNDER